MKNLAHSTSGEITVRRKTTDYPVQSICLAREYQLDVEINGEKYCRMVCTPDNLRELAVGRLASDGVLQEIDVLEEMFCVADKNSGAGTVRIVMGAASDRREPEKNLPPALWTEDGIGKLFQAMMAGSELYRNTASTHSCILMRGGEILCTMDDIGRHNAFDKVIGWALIRRIPLNECVVFSSGRIPVDMVCKAVRAGITVLASKALPTAEAVALAEEKKLTLLHRSCLYGFLQFTHQE